MRFVGKAWRLLVGIKDALVLLFMLLFFGGALRGAVGQPLQGQRPRAARSGSTSPARSSSSRPQRDPLDVLGGGSVTREYRLRELIHALDTAAERRPDPGGRARSRHLHRRRPDRDRQCRRGARPGAPRGQAGRRLRHRLWRRQLPARRPCRRDLARSAGRGADRRAGRHQPLLCRPARAARRHRQRLPGRHLQVGGRALHAQRHVARGARGQPGARRRALGDLAAGRRARRGRARRSPPMSPIRRASSHAAGGDMAQAALRAGPGRPDRRPHRLRPRMAELAGDGDERRARQLPRRPLRRLDRRASGRATRAARSACSPSPATIVDGHAGARHGRRRDDRRRPRARARARQPQGAGGAGRFAGRLGDSPRSGSAARSSPAKARGIPVVDLDGLGRGDRRLLDRDRRRHRSSPSPRRSPARSACSASCRASKARCERLGVGADGVRTTPLSGEPDLLRGPSPEADRLLQMGVESTYRRFIGLVVARAAACRRRGSTRSARAGCGTAAPRASSAWSTGSARSTTRSPRRRGGRRSIPTTRGRSISRRSRASSAELLARRWPATRTTPGAARRLRPARRSGPRR